MKKGDHDNTLVRDRGQETALLHFPPLLPPHSLAMVSNHPPGEKGFFKCVALFSLWQEECEFPQDYRDKRIFPSLSTPSACIKEGFHINQTGKTRLLLEDKLFPTSKKCGFSNFLVYTFSLFLFLLLFPLFSFSLSLCWNYFKTHIFSVSRLSNLLHFT